MEKNIAVVGLGGLFPGAKSIDEFWQNIVAKKVSIRPLPEELFEREVFYRPDLLTALNKEDKSVTTIAGWIEDLRFDTVRKYKIPPSVAEHMDANQHAALSTAAQALAMNSLKDVPSDRVAVIYGNGMVGTQYGDALVRVEFQLVEHFLRKHAGFQRLPAKEQEEIIEYVRANVLKDSIPITEDSAPGILPNIIAARIANAYDFHGPSFTVDAACASVLAAVIKGIQGLHLNQYDAVMCGGSDMPLKQLGFILFSALNALSPDGSFPFDERANGFVMGQGAGAVTLKRLDDAIRNKDTIYAVITGYGEASDGKGKYIAAPNADWQARTIEKACRMAGYSVDTVEMVEAHGTATRVGDVVEVVGLKQAFSALGATRKNYCGLTSVKSNIGHLKSAAGIAGLVKAILSVHHKTLPPTAGFERVNPKLELEGSPFYILDEVREWEGKREYPRRANVSSFGFGGADYHIALEEFREEDHRQPLFNGVNVQPTRTISGTALQSSVPPPRAELVFFAADSVSGLDAQVAGFLVASRQRNDISFAEFSSLHNYTLRSNASSRLAILASSPEDLATNHAFFTASRERAGMEILRTKGIFFKEGKGVTPDEIALLFPGQASQYLRMFRSLYDTYDSVRTCYRKADAYWFSRFNHTVTSLLFPTGGSDDEALERLRQTQNAHPSIFITSYALYDLLAHMGLSARFMLGHSLGEITALAAAGKVSFEDALTLVERRGSAFSEAHLEDPGAMLSVKGSADEARQLLAESGVTLAVANMNSPRQTIVAGSSPEVDRFKRYLDGKKIASTMLFVSHAFHTPLLKEVAERFYGGIQNIRFCSTPVRVAMNHTGTYYPDDPEVLPTIPMLLRDQILQPVNFLGSVRKLFEDGVRLFIEVGPGSILSGLVKDTLAGRDVTILTSNFRSADDLASLDRLCGALFAEGVPLMLPSTRSVPRNVAVSDSPVVQAPAQPERENVPAGKVTVVYSGVAVGLPGSYKETFRDDNFDQLFEGRNLIERLTDEEKQAMVDLQVTRLIKDESGPTFKLLTSLDDVIQLAGKIGRIDMVRDYHIDEKVVQNMTSSIANGVAAGYEALKDAQIPLVREYVRTTTGKMLPQKLALPSEMQEETGVIFANGFPLIDPIIQEVSRSVSYVYGSKTRKELMAFYESIISRVKDQEAKKLLTDWYTLYYSRLNDVPGQDEVYRFNHHFMTQISAQANNVLATLLNAKGPNFQLNAACSSTSNAITIAEDFIRSGRVKRMIVVGADDPTSKANLPILGAGFLCTGAATNEGDLYKAAIPFDRRRNGMIVGAGAVGIVLETKDEVEKRGVAAVCELLGTHSFNTAKHISQIDVGTFAEEMDRFIARMERDHGLRREEMARTTVYISHETATPPRGGCSQTEAEALKRAFGDNVRKIIVGNTKGMTGHTMGASLEDAVAAKALQYGKCPPVVNYAQPDPMLDGLNLWKGGSHDRVLALKMSAGFGSQGHFALLRKASSGDQRITDQSKYAGWLNAVAGEGNAAVERRGRVLVVKDHGPALTSPAAPAPAPAVGRAGPRDGEREQRAGIGVVSRSTRPGPDKTHLAGKVVELIAQVTSYPPEMLDPEMEFQADLGISEEKRAAIAAKLAGQFTVSEAALKFSAESTIGQLVDRLSREIDNSTTREKSPSAPPLPVPIGHQKAGKEGLVAEVIKVFSEVTKYPEDMLELDMEMEADLGIDTVKQATILSILGERYRLERQEGMQLSNYPTIRHIVDLVYERSAGASQTSPEPVSTGRKSPASEAPPVLQAVALPSEPDPKRAVIEDTLRVFSEVTKYPEDMLELDMEMEADLGIDTVKQATILSILGETYHLERQEGMQLSNYPTIRHIADLIYERGKAVERAPAMPGAAEEKKVEVPETGGGLPPALGLGDLSRQVPMLMEEELGPREGELKGRNVWILGDDEPVLKTLASACEMRGSHVRTFTFPQSATVVELERAIATFVGNNTVDVLIDCTHIGGASTVRFDQLPREKAQDLLFLSGEARFAFVKHLSKNHVKHPARILCITAIDGSFGIDASSRVTDPTFGALTGFYKALRKEWTDSDVRIIDFSPRVVAEAFEGCIDHVLAEAEHAGVGVEIAYPNGKRMVVKIGDREPAGGSSLTYSDRDTFLITGGGTGIASRILLQLAKEYPAKFIVVDLVALPENIESLAALDERGLDQLKSDLHAKLRQNNPKVTPAALNREFGKITKAIEIHATLTEVRRLQRTVVYVPCDVRDHAALERMLTEARKTVGPITAIVHAAGLDQSHLIDQKSIEEFHTVFGVKTEGATNLADICRTDPLRLVVAFSSIAGRFGNAAQLDYSAANSFLNDWVKMMCHTREDVHALSLAWSGWKDVGIAWRNEFVRQKSEEMGLNFIEVEQGVAAFMREITHRSGAQEIILHRGLNGFVEKGLASTYLPDYPLIDRITKQDGKIDRAYRQFSVRRDALIDQHRLGKVPILPAVGYAELAAEYYALQAGRKKHYVLRDMTFPNAFKLFREQPRELFIEGTEEGGGSSWSIEIKSMFRPAKSEEVAIILHSRVTVSDEVPDLNGLAPEAWTYHQAEPISLPAEESLLLIKSEGPDQRIILGPLYNDVLRDSRSKAPVLVYPRGTTYPTYFPREQLTNAKYPLGTMLVNPCFLDSVYQACAAHLLVRTKRVYLPYQIAELGIVRVPREEGLYTCHTQIVEETEELVGFNVVMIDGGRNVCYYARNATFRLINL